jgi:hypothetical protein
MEDHVYIVIGLLALVFIVSFMRRRVVPAEDFLPSLPLVKPALYWFVDAEPNTRKWWDFHGRRSVTPNRGYLEVALDALNRTQGSKFNIVPLVGRMATMEMIGDPLRKAIDLPPALWRAYVISSLCAKKGGLVLDGNSVLTVGPTFTVSGAAAMFGTDHDEPVAGGAGPGPDQYIGYAAAAGHPAWIFALREYEHLVERGPQAWTAAIARRMPRTLWETQKTLGMTVVREADGSRLPDGSLRQLEDYFGRLSVPENPRQALAKNAVYVAYDGDMLERRYEFTWFLRLSPEDIKTSDLMWAQYAGL